MENVLIIDDEPEITRVFVHVAESAGFRSFATTNPSEFLNWVEQKNPSYILMDLKMSEMDGVELLRHLAKAKCKAKIILISGFDPRVVEVTQQLGVEQGLNIAGTLHKPVSALQLRSLLKQTKTQLDTSAEALKQAIINQEFFLQLQPKLDLASKTISGLEVLLRWLHPSKGLVPPDKFIPQFEKHGLFRELSDYVIQHACIAINEMDQMGLKIKQTSINVSAGDLSDLELATRLKKICHSLQISPQRITLEVTETVAMADPVAAKDNLARLRLAGFGLSLDDFGTGFSSLAFLRSMPFNEIKIDKIFVRDALRMQSDQVIIQAIISLGSAFSMKIVAEGCEDGETLTLMEELGCDSVQGFHIARPMDLQEAAQFIRNYGH